MKNKLIQGAKLCVGVAVLSLAGLGHAANLLSNPGFETGEAGWVFGPVPPAALFSVERESIGGRNVLGSSGPGVAAFNPSDESNTGMISRSIDLIASNTYALEFYLKGDPSVFSFSLLVGDVTTSFAQLIDPFEDEETITDASDPLKPVIRPTGWRQYSASLSGFGSGTTLQFIFDGNTVAYLDDVSLECDPDSCRDNGGGNNNVPEPGSLLLVGVALAGMGAVRRSRKTTG